jgi:hypothetical protein
VVRQWRIGPLMLPVHGVFLGLGVLAAAPVFIAEARRRDAVNEQSLVAVTGALVGGAIGMRLSGWAEHLDLRLNPTLLQAWEYGSRSILGGLLGAYLGVLIAKRIGGYTGKTGDLFAPAVALGMAIGRIGCYLTEAPGRPTHLPWGIHAPATTPKCPGCLSGAAMHPSFLYEIGFQLAAFVLDLLTEHRERTEVYLQYDGLSLAAHRYHRGGDLCRAKRDALRRLSQREIFTTLVMTAALGVNDGETGEVVGLALDTPFVGGVCIQPQFGSGRSGFIDPGKRLTHTGVLKRLGPQTGGLVTWRDLTALPCSHPHCCSVGYLLKDDAGQWRPLVALIGQDILKARLGLVANRIADSDIPGELRLAVRESLLGLLSEQSSLSHPQMPEVWRMICENCDLGIGTLLTLASGALRGRRARLRRLLGERVVRITVKPFMDMSTMIEERLVQCCVHVGPRSSQDQCAPFCAVQAWPQLGAQRLSVAARRSLPVVG